MSTADSPSEMLMWVDLNISRIESYIIRFMNQIDDSLAEQADNPKVPLVPPKPLRKLSEPAHKTTTPVKPILKYSPSVGSTPLSNISNLRSEPSLQLARSGNLQPSNKDRIPLSFASRNEISLCIGPSYGKRHNSRTALSSESAKDLSKSPGWGTKATRGSTAKIESANERNDYWGNWDHNKELPPTPFVNAPTPLGSPWPAPSSALPPTPPLTPAPRYSFSQALPSQRYPLTPHNSIRTRHRSPPKATSELERKSSTVPFPSRPSFTFSPPDLPSPSDFPLPPSLAPRPFSRSHRLRSRASSMSRLAEHANVSHPKLAQRPSLPSLSMREPRPPSPPVGSSFAKTRTAPKRTASKTSGTRKRRKVAFALPPGSIEHPRLERRPTPYYQSVSSMLERVIDILAAPFRLRSPEEKQELREKKEQEQKEKRERKEWEELVGSFPNS